MKPGHYKIFIEDVKINTKTPIDKIKPLLQFYCMYQFKPGTYDAYTDTHNYVIITSVMQDYSKLYPTRRK